MFFITYYYFIYILSILFIASRKKLFMSRIFYFIFKTFCYSFRSSATASDHMILIVKSAIRVHYKDYDYKIKGNIICK